MSVNHLLNSTHYNSKLLYNVILIWFKLYFLCIPTHEELQLQVFTDMYDIQNGIQKKVS